MPNGNPPQTEKYPYKLGFMERLRRRAAALLRLEEPLVLAGDYNVIPEPIDARDPAGWVSDALFLPQTRAAFRRLLALGLTDAFRACDQAPERYSFWDYQAGAFQKNNGIRIDHLLLSPQAADKLVTCRIDKETRAGTSPRTTCRWWRNSSMDVRASDGETNSRRDASFARMEHVATIHEGDRTGWLAIGAPVDAKGHEIVLPMRSHSWIGRSCAGSVHHQGSKGSTHFAEWVEIDRFLTGRDTLYPAGLAERLSGRDGAGSAVNALAC